MAMQTITSRTRMEETPAPLGEFPKDDKNKRIEDEPPRQNTNVMKDNNDNNIPPKAEGDIPEKPPKPMKNGGDSVPSSHD